MTVLQCGGVQKRKANKLDHLRSVKKRRHLGRRTGKVEGGRWEQAKKRVAESTRKGKCDGKKGKWGGEAQLGGREPCSPLGGWENSETKGHLFGQPSRIPPRSENQPQKPGEAKLEGKGNKTGKSKTQRSGKRTRPG